MACHHHVSEALRLSAELLKIANDQEIQCEHDGCLLLDGVIRDSAWKIRQAALQWRIDLDEATSAENCRAPRGNLTGPEQAR